MLLSVRSACRRCKLVVFLGTAIAGCMLARNKLLQSGTTVVAPEQPHSPRPVRCAPDQAASRPFSELELTDLLANNRSHSHHCLLWPDTNPDSDRIAEQIAYRPPPPVNVSGDEWMRLKWIYLPVGGWGAATGALPFNGCRVDRCRTFNEKYSPDGQYRHLEHADAVMVALVKTLFFYYMAKFPPKRLGRQHSINEKYQRQRVQGRLSHQVWIWEALESPMHMGPPRALRHVINWTNTYRFDSEIPLPYAKWMRFRDGSYWDSVREVAYTLENMNNFQTAIKNSIGSINNDTADIVWVNSNCRASNHRGTFVRQLQKHLPIHIYGNGHCGGQPHRPCPVRRDRGGYGLWKCDKTFDKRYTFLLAFENSNCRDYITEKLLENALSTNLIPIVYGARKEEYERVAPPNSFIHVDDFDGNTAKLAAYVRSLLKDKRKLQPYRAWKTQGYVSINRQNWCRICTMLHVAHMRPPKWYRNVAEWWRGSGVCKSVKVKGATFKNIEN